MLDGPVSYLHFGRLKLLKAKGMDLPGHKHDVRSEIRKAHVHDCLEFRAHPEVFVKQVRHPVDSVRKLAAISVVPPKVNCTYLSPVDILKSVAQICMAHRIREACSVWLLPRIVVNNVRYKSSAIQLCVSGAQNCVPEGHGRFQGRCDEALVYL